MAIALPPGYVIDFGPLWASNAFAHDKLNEVDVPYGDIVKAAVKEALACLKKGESFDFVVESRALRNKGYERIVRIRLDGSVEKDEDSACRETVTPQLQGEMNSPQRAGRAQR